MSNTRIISLITAFVAMVSIIMGVWGVDPDGKIKETLNAIVAFLSVVLGANTAYKTLKK